MSDFGLTDFKPEAGSVAAPGEGASAASALQVGTPFWQAPECLEGKEFTEVSCCAVAYTALSWMGASTFIHS